MTGSVTSRRRPGDVTEINFRCQFVRFFKEKTQSDAPYVVFIDTLVQSVGELLPNISSRATYVAFVFVGLVSVMPSHQSELSHCKTLKLIEEGIPYFIIVYTF